MSESVPEPSLSRFAGVQRLYGEKGWQRLQRAHVCVIGLGGVGSWSVEALARSGIGSLTLVDLDDVCVSNVNRQIHAVEGEIGKPKAEAMVRRVRAIHPECDVRPLCEFFSKATAESILSFPFTFVLDAMDRPAVKSLLVAQCTRRRIPLFVVGAAGGRQSALSLKITDLAFSTHDPLLREVRSQLRRDYGFSRGEKAFGVKCLFSGDDAVLPWQVEPTCGAPGPGHPLRLDCATGYGSACHVTGAFGLAAAGHILQSILDSGD
jgi:tRNA A37 threonylcarbamoyladenosine dehydratase